MIDRGLLDRILDEQEATFVSQFYDNQVMREAVKKVVLASVYYNGTLKKGTPADPNQNFMLALANTKGTDEAIGREARAIALATALLESGFAALASYKREKPDGGIIMNPAR